MGRSKCRYRNYRITEQKMRKYIFLIIAFLVLTGCEKDKSASFVDGEEVYVHLSLEANTPISFNIEDNGASVKSVYDPDGTTETAELIKNLWIIQYNGTSDNATLLGEPNYIENFSAFISQSDKQVKLVSTSNPSTIFFIANTFEGKNQFTIAQGSTIADLKSRTKLVDGEESILGNGSGTYHPIFYTTVIADEIKEGSEINGTLKRNVAKVSVKLTNNTPVSERVTISTVQLCSIPHASYYIPDNSSETFPSAGNNTINYSSIDWTTNSVPLEFTTYLPVNKRGRIENTAPASKNINPPQGATYLVLKGSYMENGEEIPISYTFYLGKDMVQDFNIEANHAYSFNIA
ncbi:MAG: DUF4906 domain-containing protein, partial [Bacteroidales bacterium]|nr:DUF4906 domain-containing protein [Bacteroidales bacterium]